jgi:hypothetical protein
MSQEPVSSDSQSVPVAPDSVRVWRGFRLASVTNEGFFSKLGSFFMPGTVQIQTPVGLTAYLPSVLPVEKPSVVPDEIALVFYEYPNAYEEAKETVGGRAYSDLHGVAFDLTKSLSGFPKLFEGVFESLGRYYLIDKKVDWQQGFVNVFLGVRNEMDEAAFLKTASGWLGAVQDQGEAGPDGAIASGTGDYVVYWEHWADEQRAAGSLIPELARVVRPVYQQPIAPYQLDEGLWCKYPGIKDVVGRSFNFQFKRR